MAVSKTNVSARDNRGKCYAVCPKCQSTMTSTKVITHKSRGKMMWVCGKEECNNMVPTEFGNDLEKTYVAVKK